MGYKLSRKSAEDRDSEGETEDTPDAAQSSNVDSETSIQARQENRTRQAVEGGVLQRSSKAGGVSAGTEDTGGTRQSYVDFDQGPNRRELSERYDMTVRDGQAAKVQRLESDFGSDRVEGWVDEGMTVKTMGKPQDMQAFRERQDGRPDAVPQDVERQNEASVYRNADQHNDGPAGDAGAPDAVRSVVSSAGHSLDGTIQREMEDKTGDSFGDVRIHTGPQAADAAEKINARAFTVGNHVAFNRGEYQPETTDGKRVLAHELTHVRQQTGGQVSMLPKEGALQVDPDPALEREAEETADRLVSEEPTTVTRMGSEMHVQRLPDEDRPDEIDEDEPDEIDEDEPDDGDKDDPDEDRPDEIDEDEPDNGDEEEQEEDDEEEREEEEEVIEDSGNNPIPDQIREHLTDIKMFDEVPPPLLELLENEDIQEEEFQETLKDMWDYYLEETEEGEKLQEKLEKLQEITKATAEELWEEHPYWVGGVVGGTVLAILGGMYAADKELPDQVTEWIEEQEITYEGDSVIIEFNDFEYEGVPFSPDELGGKGRIAYELDEDSEVETVVDYRDTSEEESLEVVGEAEGENYEINARYLSTDTSLEDDDEEDDSPQPAAKEFLMTEGGTLLEVDGTYEGDDYEVSGEGEYVETANGESIAVAAVYDTDDYEVSAEGEHIETADGETLVVAGGFDNDDYGLDAQYEETPDGETIAVTGVYKGTDYTVENGIEFIETEAGNTVAVTGAYEDDDYELEAKYVEEGDEESLSLGGEYTDDDMTYELDTDLDDIWDSVSLINAQAQITQETEERLRSMRAEFEETPEGSRYLLGGSYDSDRNSAELELEHMPDGNRWMASGERGFDLSDDLDLTLGGEAESLPESFRAGIYADVAGEVGEASAGLDMTDTGDGREYEAQLEAGIEANDRLKLTTENMLRRTPEGTSLESSLEARYQASENLQGHLNAAHERGLDGTRDTKIRGGVNYNADNLWLNLEGSYSDEQGAGVEAGLLYRF